MCSTPTPTSTESERVGTGEVECVGSKDKKDSWRRVKEGLVGPRYRRSGTIELGNYLEPLIRRA